MSTEFTLNHFFNSNRPSSTLAINEQVKARWAKGQRLFHMGFGESRFAVHDKLHSALSEHAAEKSYLSSKGYAPLCETVARYYSGKLELDFKADQVIVGPGSKALIYALQLALGADLFLPTPSWVSYAPQASLLGNRHFYIPQGVELGCHFELSALDKLVQASRNRQKLLIVNSPNNPTGQMYTGEFLEALANYCREQNILVISDEIYALVQHGSIKHESIAKYYPEGTFVLGGLSKHLSIGGWRLGVALLPDTPSGQKLMTALEVIASEIWSSVASPVQYAAQVAYSNDASVEAYIKTCTAIHGVRTRFLHEGLASLGIRCTEPDGAFYITANFDHWKPQLNALGIHTSTQLAGYLLDTHDLATLACDSFGMDPAKMSLRLASSYLDMEKNEDSQRLVTLFESNIGDNEFMSPRHHPNMHAAIDEFERFVRSMAVVDHKQSEELLS